MEAPAAPASSTPPAKTDLARWREHLRDERGAARLYRAMAAAERDQERAGIFNELAEVEEEHARLWERKLREAGVEPAPDRISAGESALLWLGRRFGNRLLLPMAERRERRADAGYTGLNDPELAGMAREERLHGAVFHSMDSAGPLTIAQHERWHRRTGGGSMRAAVFGINDGLVSNFSLVMGVAGAARDPNTILLAGLAGMFAGAFSMAAGEWVSMQSQREMFEREIAQEREELAAAPADEARELELIYRAKGVPREEAKRLAEKIVADPTAALDTLAREELGLDPQELGSPWGSAFSSFGAFLAGAIIPILPYLLITGPWALRGSLIASAVAMFGVGALLSLFTARNALLSALRMLLIGAAAATVTWSVGRLVGVSLS